MKRTLFLFDIDGSIVSTNRSGYHAFLDAFKTIFFNRETKPLISTVNFAGRTDGAIFRELAACNTIRPSENDWKRFKALYARYLSKRAKNASEWTVFEGVYDAIAYLSKNAALGLLTGNLKRTAKIKLEAINLWKPFPVGAFADDALAREALAEIALTRAQKRFRCTFKPERVFVIGDTEHDIQCGKHIGANTIAVKTGYADPLALQNARPDILCATLAEIDFARLLND